MVFSSFSVQNASVKKKKKIGKPPPTSSKTLFCLKYVYLKCICENYSQWCINMKKKKTPFFKRTMCIVLNFIELQRKSKCIKTDRGASLGLGSILLINDTSLEPLSPCHVIWRRTLKIPAFTMERFRLLHCIYNRYYKY